MFTSIYQRQQASIALAMLGLLFAMLGFPVAFVFGPFSALPCSILFFVFMYGAFYLIDGESEAEIGSVINRTANPTSSGSGLNRRSSESALSTNWTLRHSGQTPLPSKSGVFGDSDQSPIYEGLETPVRLAIGFSSEDRIYLNTLTRHLSPLVEEGLIRHWDFTTNPAGIDWVQANRREFSEADIVVLLLSSDFYSSRACLDELYFSLREEKLIVGVLVRQFVWHLTPVRSLQLLPKSGRPINELNPADWDQSFSDIVNEIYKSIEKHFLNFED